MKASGIFPMSWDDEFGQHVIFTNIPQPEESNIEIISVLFNYGMVSDMYTRK